MPQALGLQKMEDRQKGQETDKGERDMKDYLVRATAAEGQIRAFAITSRDTVETARARHDTSPVVTAALGRLLTAGAMMGVMMKGEDDPSWRGPGRLPQVAGLQSGSLRSQRRL